MTTIRIGTRGSQLALWQANEVSRLLANAGVRSEIVTIRTTGDKRHDVSLATIGGKGLFVKELEEALDQGTIDIAVHSLKDVPSIIPERFSLTAFLERADPRDAWVQPDRIPIGDLPAGAVIGTSSPRRRAQIVARYPQFSVEDMRGNVDTRISKLRAGQYAGAILASAGLTRLGRQGEITSWFPAEELLPAAGQGIVGIETLRTNKRAIEVVDRINHAPTALAARCERGVLQKFDTLLDCYSAAAVHAVSDGSELFIRAFLAEVAGPRSIRSERRGAMGDPDAIIDAVASDLTSQGALALLQAKEVRP
ncbi:MAG TPA: hydroxymethylbilane synthase [Thermoanaerobaculia bacterium]|nr:hydroxymethylbilane synthase [Thermoanaerobaculia bacterium]